MFGRNLVLSALCVLVATMAVAVDEPRHLETSPVPDTVGTCIVFHELTIHPSALREANLSPADEQTAARIVQHFDGAFRRLGRMLRSETIDHEEFAETQSRMVDSSRKGLVLRLTPDGAAKVEDYMKKEKTRITANPPRPTEN
jgi:hypothetical protein